MPFGHIPVMEVYNDKLSKRLIEMKILLLGGDRSLRRTIKISERYPNSLTNIDLMKELISESEQFLPFRQAIINGESVVRGSIKFTITDVSLGSVSLTFRKRSRKTLKSPSWV